MEWPKRARTVSWESGVLTLDGEKQFEVPELTAEIMDQLDELIHRTPGYSGWQQEYWRAHCGDYCAYLGHVGARELRALGVLEEVLDDPMWDEAQKDMIRESVNGGHLQCYLFQCLHCGKHLVWMDFD